MLPADEAAHKEAIRWVKMGLCRSLFDQVMACQEVRSPAACAEEQNALQDCLGSSSDHRAYQQLQYRGASLCPTAYKEYSTCMDCAQDKSMCFDLWQNLQVASAKTVVEHIRAQQARSDGIFTPPMIYSRPSLA